eukprot:gene14286-16863_t
MRASAAAIWASVRATGPGWVSARSNKAAATSTRICKSPKRLIT